MKKTTFSINGKIRTVTNESTDKDIIIYAGHTSLNVIASGDNESEVKDSIKEWAWDNRGEHLCERVCTFAEDEGLNPDDDFDDLTNKYFDENPISSLCCNLIDGDYKVIKWSDILNDETM